MFEDGFCAYMGTESLNYKVKVVSANIYIPGDHSVGEIATHITEFVNNLVIKKSSNGGHLFEGDFNNITGDVIAYIPTNGLINTSGIPKDINISNDNLIKTLESYINWEKIM